MLRLFRWLIAPTTKPTPTKTAPTRYKPRKAPVTEVLWSRQGEPETSALLAFTARSLIDLAMNAPVEDQEQRDLRYSLIRTLSPIAVGERVEKSRVEELLNAIFDALDAGVI